MDPVNNGGQDPALNPPTGVTPDFTAPNPLYSVNLAVQTIFVVLTTSFISLRCVVRYRFIGVWKFEDWLCILSWAVFVPIVAICYSIVPLGAGSHQWNIPKDDLPSITYACNVTTIIYAVAMLLTKDLVLLTYMNIFASSRGSKEWLFMVTMIVANSIFFTISAFGKIFQCLPREKIWNPSVPGSCVINQGMLLTASGIWNTFFDILVLILPALFVSRLKLNPKTKWKIISLFTLAAIAFPVFSIVGIAARARYAYSTDLTYSLPRIFLFAEAEISSGLICVCVPSTSFAVKLLWSRRQNYADIEQRQRTQDPGGPESQYLDTVLEDIDSSSSRRPRHFQKWRDRAAQLTVQRSLSRAGANADFDFVDSNNLARTGREGILKTTEVRVRYGSESASSDKSVIRSDEIRRGTFLAPHLDGSSA